MIKNSNNKLYIGITEHPTMRLKEHNTQRGADFTKYQSNFKIVFLEQYETLAQARQRNSN
jgi:predicted GIY-YIG superfamily endonuclease